MARIKIKEIIESLDSELKSALEAAVLGTISNSTHDRNALFRAFVRSVGRKCNTWVNVPDRYIENGD